MVKKTETGDSMPQRKLFKVNYRAEVQDKHVFKINSLPLQRNFYTVALI